VRYFAHYPKESNMHHVKVIDFNDLVNAIAARQLKQATTVASSLARNTMARLRRDMSPTVSTVIRRATSRGR
jgi:hypothetical protein